MARIELFTIAERVPIPGEDVILYEIYEGTIEEMSWDKIEISICDPEELNLVPEGEHPNFMWSKGKSCLYSQIWSYGKIN